MMILRVLIALAVVIQALSSFFPLLGNVLFKVGRTEIASGPAARMAPLWAATPWWQLAVWLLGVLLLLVVAWRVIRRRPALGVYAAAIAISLGLNWLMQNGTVYREVFRDAPAGFDFARLVILLLGGALIWWVEQQPAKAAVTPEPANSKGPA
jgi:peptidoglycan/LPS O-acetylase OafA/YrhL